MLCCGIDQTGKFFPLINKSELSLQCYLRKFFVLCPSLNHNIMYPLLFQKTWFDQRLFTADK